MRSGTRVGPVTASLPRWVFLPAAAAAVFVVLPLAAMAAEVDWSRFGSLVTSPASVSALLLSLRTWPCTANAAGESSYYYY